MKTKAAIHEMGLRYGIEAAHTEHVAKLALELFDGFALEGLDKPDRRILYAAAHLHDIGYAEDPVNHVLTGARILREHPVESFSAEEWSCVIGIVLLHKRDWRSMLKHASFPDVEGSQVVRIRKLAALLRIADGLDHGHIQDASIFYCRAGKKVDKIGVTCGWYDGNIPWAEQKADLWEATFKRPFRFEGCIESGRKVYKGVVFKGDPVMSAARRILYSQAVVMRDRVPGMIEGRDPECLHDYRIAMRRFRAALRFFRPFLAGTSAQDVDNRLKEISARLGPLRDAHVALETARWLDVEQREVLVRQLEHEVFSANDLLREIIQSENFMETVREIARFLRVEIPAQENTSPRVRFTVFAEERIYMLLSRIMEMDPTTFEQYSEEDLHAARKLIRRGRYYSEFGAPVLKKEIAKTARHLKTMTGALGDIRDVRMFAPKQVPAEHVRLLEAQAWARFRKGADKLSALSTRLQSGADWPTIDSHDRARTNDQGRTEIFNGNRIQPEGGN